MKLTALDASFHRYTTTQEEVNVVDGDPDTWRARGCPTRPEVRPVTRLPTVDQLADAQGVMFLCPLCYQRNGGEVGTHAIDVTFAGRGVTDEQGSHNRDGQPTRWTVSGTGLADLTLAPSVDLSRTDGKGCGWHGFVRNGDAA